jgi:glycosyltransferase involved in cell wall biosynthesis
MTFGFFSTMTGVPWGGSEQLWSRAALRLLERGHDVVVNYRQWPSLPSSLRRLQDNDASVTLRPHGTTWARVRALGRSALRRVGLAPHRHRRWVAPADFVLVSSGWHQEDLSATRTCRALGVPYATLLHCASYHDWLGPAQADRVRAAYRHAEQSYFVSDENRDIIETMTATHFDPTAVVDNPINVNPDEPPPWSSTENWRLACVGRLHCRSKGQDLILKVLRRCRWRNRPVHVTFYGHNHNSEQRLRRLIRRYHLTGAVTLNGHAPLRTIWRDNHALLLPSRYEGMPMATLEAMLWGRPAIVTDCGRNGTFVDDGETGFLLPAATTDLLDEAMERAWKRRHDWQSMGRLAAERVPERYGSHPVATFADELVQLARTCS